MPYMVRKNVVGFTLSEVSARITPRNRLQLRAHEFEFNDSGALIGSDILPEEQGLGASRLAEEARKYWEDENNTGDENAD